MPNLYNLQFTDTELDTIAAALDDFNDKVNEEVGFKLYQLLNN